MLSKGLVISLTCLVLLGCYSIGMDTINTLTLAIAVWIALPITCTYIVGRLHTCK